MPDEPERLRHSAYSPEGLKEYVAYKADVDRRVAAGHLSAKEGAILTAVRMQGVLIEGKAGEPVRRPTCQRCGAPTTIVGGMAEKFRCACSPDVEQSVADRVRAGKRPSAT